jgi:hypothetical protein
MDKSGENDSKIGSAFVIKIDVLAFLCSHIVFINRHKLSEKFHSRIKFETSLR